MKRREGFVDFKGYKTWYVVYGDLTNEKPPLLVLHGGPGYPHDYLENLSGLAAGGRAVVMYDQLGCGKSDRPDKPGLWTIDLFLEEIDAVRRALGLDRLCLLGSSWGGSLAAEYILTKPKGVEKVVFHSPLMDTELWVSEADKLKDQLSPRIAATMRHHEQAGTTDSKEYLEAYQEFRSAFLCRVQPYPELMQRADDGAGEQVYTTMWGPSEAFATGTLKNWSVMDRLHNISIPALFISGEYDEATPYQIGLAHSKIPGSEWVLLDNCSHTSNLEAPEKYLSTVKQFLD